MSKHSSTDNGIYGPFFSEDFTEQIVNPANLRDTDNGDQVEIVSEETA